MITERRGEEAISDIEQWASQMIHGIDDQVSVRGSYHDADSNTYVLRFVKGSRVLLFRLSEDQVHTLAREPECERTIRSRMREIEKWS